MSTNERASLLTIPCELRNAIYMYIFDLELADLTYPTLPTSPDELAIALRLRGTSDYRAAYYNANRAARKLRILRTCKQIHQEASLLALSLTPFHINGECTYPDVFDIRSRALSPAKVGAIRHLTLSARISHLRALNEAWAGLPFGHPCLHLDTITIIPHRPEVHSAAFAEIADLSQSHTLAYIFCETLKSLRNVRCMHVRNHNCFNEVVWRLFYRSLVYRLWRWGGGKCGIRFESGEVRPGGSELKGNQWFKAYLTDKEGEGVECGEEVCRLVGQTGELPDPNLAGIAP
ncbi:Hypothetical predicted protein [Lecanosticta acicola]|uniref:Uncharacterized protein n=1 Tax=Lecanosticta acicola TaxID=111012 RepID=A0AAI9E884_9PEZI|nr:Hypothetical predicted protein [Lecanosticta acicola]